MTYYVYRATGRGRDFTWTLSSQHEDLPEAEKAAEALCPKGYAIDTEPSRELKRAFFGSKGSERWSSMITTTPERRT